MLTICQMKFSYDYDLIKQKAMANLMKLFCMIYIFFFFFLCSLANVFLFHAFLFVLVCFGSVQ
jgi:hypothetical protein